jgi:hypothetical protein
LNHFELNHFDMKKNKVVRLQKNKFYTFYIY